MLLPFIVALPVSESVELASTFADTCVISVAFAVSAFARVVCSVVIALVLLFTVVVNAEMLLDSAVSAFARVVCSVVIALLLLLTVVVNAVMLFDSAVSALVLADISLCTEATEAPGAFRPIATQSKDTESVAVAPISSQICVMLLVMKSFPPTVSADISHSRISISPTVLKLAGIEIVL
jgi:hypothetical protein